MIAKFALSAAALLQLAKGQIVIGDDANDQSWSDVAEDITGEEWASVAENANLTQHSTFIGRNVEASFPRDPQEGWNFHFSIQDNLETNASDDQLVAGTISMWGPDGEVDFDDSWRLCVYVWPVKDSSISGFGSLTDSCSGAVAPECTDDLRKNAIKNFADGCPTYANTPSCLRDIQERTRGNSLEITSENAGRLIGNDTSFYRRIYGKLDPSDDEEDYQDLLTAAGHAQAIVTVFGPAGDSEAEPFGEVNCVLPDTVEDTVEEGAIEQPDTDGAASGFAAFAGWAALSAAVAYQLL